MVRASLFAFALVALLPITALAHGPTRQKVIDTVENDATPEAVWQINGKFQDMGWHPADSKLEGKGENTVDATSVRGQEAL
jgi:hypothetical protein